MQQIDFPANELVLRLLALSETEHVCLLDSCGVGHLGSHLLIAGVDPIAAFEIFGDAPEQTLAILDEKFASEHPAIFTLSYDFGEKLQNMGHVRTAEPDAFVAQFAALVVHDYDTGQTFLKGGETAVKTVRSMLEKVRPSGDVLRASSATSHVASNFTRDEYSAAVEQIREYIRKGDTYQTNLTQQMTCELPEGTTPQQIFWRLRSAHPAPFAAFIRRESSTVVSASPERFFRIGRSGRIDTSPIKGTRRRGRTPAEDASLRNELQNSAKDRAENTMIVDLMRNDLGRVCQFGSVEVEKLCSLEEHPTLFHLVSTVAGKLRAGTRISDVLRAVFPCGSITGAPKMRTMRIIDELETTDRGLSMGAIGCYLPESFGEFESIFDVNVAIRTMVIRDGVATFNVGGGVVIDSDPNSEYDESILKAKALMNAIGASL